MKMDKKQNNIQPATSTTLCHLDEDILLVWPEPDLTLIDSGPIILMTFLHGVRALGLFDCE